MISKNEGSICIKNPPNCCHKVSPGAKASNANELINAIANMASNRGSQYKIVFVFTLLFSKIFIKVLLKKWYKSSTGIINVLNPFAPALLLFYKTKRHLCLHSYSSLMPVIYTRLEFTLHYFSKNGGLYEKDYYFFPLLRYPCITTAALPTTSRLKLM